MRVLLLSVVLFAVGCTASTGPSDSPAFRRDRIIPCTVENGCLCLDADGNITICPD
jgi:hypothetical protein